MSQRITIEIKDKIAKCLTELPVVCGNADYVVDFVFDAEWKKHDVKTAVFVVNGKATSQVFAGNVCPIPVIQNTLITWVGVFAGTVNDGTLSTSTPALVKCIPCITDGDKVPLPPPDDVYNQIIGLIESGMLKGEQGEKGGKGEKGDKGDEGYTPQKGVYYWTEEDKAEAEKKFATKEENKLKYDKAGGIITGDVAIQGNLSVTGTTTQKDTETLRVQDNVIVANANGVDLIEEGGFAIKTDTTNAYGIMYDPVGDGVKIGLGVFDGNGKFIFTEGEAQFLATRADEIEDGNLPKWNNEKKRFDDSGEKISDFQKKTDETLETTVKQVAGAINEVNEKADGNANSLTALVETLAELMPKVVRVY